MYFTSRSFAMTVRSEASYGHSTRCSVVTFIKEKQVNQEALQKLVENISMEYFDRPFKHQAIFNTRLKTTGGRYFLQSHELDFNPLVLEKFGLEVFIGVIKHELCHYHLHITGRGHQHKDPEFKELLHKVNGLRFVPSLREKQKTTQLWKYQCLNCQLVFHRKRRFNTEKYVCARCKGKLELKGRI